MFFFVVLLCLCLLFLPAFAFFWYKERRSKRACWLARFNTFNMVNMVGLITYSVIMAVLYDLTYDNGGAPFLFGRVSAVRCKKGRSDGEHDCPVLYNISVL